MREIIFLILIFLFSLFASCQNNNSSNTANHLNSEPTIFIHVNDLYLDSILIELNIANINKDSLVFKFPKVIPGTYRYNNTNDYIKHFKCYDSDKEKLLYNRIDDNTYLIPKSERLEKITYYVTKGKSNDVYDVLTKVVAVDSFCVINPSYFIGYFDNFGEIKYNITINKPDDFSTCLTSISQNDNNDIDRFEYNSYDKLIGNPLLYSRLDTISLVNEYFNATISVYSDNKNITASMIASWIKPLSFVLNNYTSFVRNNDKPYRFMFIFSDEFEIESALEQKNASVYCLRSNWDTVFLAKTIQHLVAHEYLHTITPFNFKSNTFKEQFYENFNSKHLWLYEGVVEYLSIKANLEAKTINFSDFLQYLSMMYSSINYDDKCDKFSLLELSQNILSFDDFNCFQNVYYKGGLIAFCIDLQISIRSKGQDNLIKAIERYIAQNGKTFEEDIFIHDFFDFLHLDDLNLEIFDKDLMNQTYIAFNSIGYLLLPDKIMWGTYANHYFDLIDYTSTDSLYTLRFGENSPLRNKTIKILKIDNETVSKQLIHEKILYPLSSKKIEIEFIYNKELRRELIKPRFGGDIKYINAIKSTKKSTIIQQNNLSYFKVNIE